MIEALGEMAAYELIKAVQKKMEAFYTSRNNQMQINHPTDYNTTRNKYTEGAYSVLQNLPIPDVKIFNIFAYIPVEQIVNHILALGLPVMTFEKESD